ncbi:GSCOCG00001210001-RA-CDS [Cotesia congregata]|uniref:Uncharacterized protein n=1 Tax=Cotesia congregata TaxID=51543 RepID=A0A8J2HIY7_COTCN|nr:GSCOCG00001210001-RA-CDS [Cotesia congregata]CAG5097437.1 Protein of unknown function [Cotesia congregata]
MSDSIVNNDPDHSIVILGRVTNKNSDLFGFNEQVKNYLLLKYSEAGVYWCSSESGKEEQISVKDSPMAVINYLAKLNYHIAFISGSPINNNYYMWTLIKKGENK